MNHRTFLKLFGAIYAEVYGLNLRANDYLNIDDSSRIDDILPLQDIIEERLVYGVYIASHCKTMAWLYDNDNCFVSLHVLNGAVTHHNFLSSSLSPPPIVNGTLSLLAKEECLAVVYLAKIDGAGFVTLKDFMTTAMHDVKLIILPSRPL